MEECSILRSPARYEGSDFDSFHHDKNRAFDYPYYYEDIEIEKYYELPPLHPCFQPPQLYTKVGLVSHNKRDEVGIHTMSITEYELYMAKKIPRKNRLNDHTYGFTSIFYDQSPCTPNPEHEHKELSLEEVSDVMDDVMQPLTPQAIHITPPDNVYVAPTAIPILVELPKEFDDEFMSDIEELEQLLVRDPFSTPKELMEHVETIVECNPLKHPQYGVRHLSKSSTKQ
ncbi:hypothetical protein Tco_0386378, partial [Tanacetum coccineum]